MSVPCEPINNLRQRQFYEQHTQIHKVCGKLRRDPELSSIERKLFYKCISGYVSSDTVVLCRRVGVLKDHLAVIN